MKLIRGLHNLQPRHRGCALTIGNFDGLHCGHQAVLAKLSQRAHELQLSTAVMTFEPTPQEYFSPQTAPPRLQRLRDKLALFAGMDIDQVLCLRFNRALAELAAEEFVQRILVDGLGVRYLVVGDDFRFGANRRGDFAFLQQIGQQQGVNRTFEVVSTQTFIAGQQRVSSTRVRDALEAGDLSAASELLGRPFAICGRVAAGQQRGRTIGFPTANIRLHRMVSPVKGVFAVQVSGLGTQPLAGVANLGTRPTIDGSYQVLEVHLFDFDEDIYGKYLNVEFCKKLRDEKKFDSFDQLKMQIESDAVQAREFFRV